jgi:ABC-type transport system substrate-binding protein
MPNTSARVCRLPSILSVYVRCLRRQGTWTAPDVAQAKALIARTHGLKGTHVSIVVNAAWAGPARVLAGTLNLLGFPSKVHVYPESTYGPKEYGPITPQATPNGWIADYPAPSDFFNPLLTCGSYNHNFNNNLAAFCNHRIDAEIEKALRIQEVNPGSAVDAWAKIDRDVVNQAPWVPYETPVWETFSTTQRGENWSIRCGFVDAWQELSVTTILRLGLLTRRRIETSDQTQASIYSRRSTRLLC